MGTNGYTALNIPTALYKELQLWKTAFAVAYGKPVSYARMIRGMIDSLEDTEPAVVEEMDRMVSRHPELNEILGEYHKDMEE